MAEVNGCPLCGLEASIHSAEVYTICELCGMSMIEESPRWLLVGKSSVRTYCSPACLKKHVILSKGSMGKILSRM